MNRAKGGIYKKNKIKVCLENQHVHKILNISLNVLHIEAGTKWQLCFVDDVFKCIFLFEKIWIWIPLNFAPKDPISNKSPLIQVLVWNWIGAKPLPKPMMALLNDAYIYIYISLGYDELT